MKITIRDNESEMSIDKFKKLMKIADRSNDNSVTLLWENEPHSDIDSIFNEVKESKLEEVSLYLTPDISDYDTIRTIQFQIEKKLNIILARDFFRSNLYNDETLINSLLTFVNGFPNIRVSIEINLNYDGLYINQAVELAYKLRTDNIKFSIGLTDEDALRTVDPTSFYKDRMNILKSFLLECTKYHILPVVDCHAIPVCMYDDDMLLFTALTNYKNLVKTNCSPFIDINPRSEMSRCYAYNKDKVSVDEFEHSGEMDQFYKAVFDDKAYSKTLIPECKTCASYVLDGKSCGCLVMRGITE
jgi:hypothetical protein